uniref:LuxR C-terminal-related transcriptional regulator n=1 Tax=Thaumasiovibrio occultus TaxID=1891184 RepID=UPI00192CF03D
MAEHETLSSLLLKSSINVSDWGRILAALLDLCGASRGVISLRCRHTASVFVPPVVLKEGQSPLICGLSKEEVNTYLKYYADMDPWVAIERKHHPVVPYLMSEYLPLDELKTLPYWQWLEPQGINDCATLDIGRCDEGWIAVSVLFDGSTEGQRYQVLNTLRQYQHSLSLAWRMRQKARENTMSSVCFEQLINQIAFPAFILSPSNKLINYNHAGERFLADCDTPLQESDDELVLIDENRRCRAIPIRKYFDATEYNAYRSTPQNLEAGEWCLEYAHLGEGGNLLGVDDLLRLVIVKRKEDIKNEFLTPIWDFPGLTRRERQLVKVLATGGKVVDFSHQYKVAKSTSHSHWSNVKRKLNVGDRSEIYAQHQVYLRNRARPV